MWMGRYLYQEFVVKSTSLEPSQFTDSPEKHVQQNNAKYARSLANT